MRYAHVPDIAALVPEIPPNSIISRTIHADDHVKVVLFGFAAGQELSEHTASQPAILHILQGEGHLTLGEDTLAATTGTWAYMPPHLRHSIVAKTPLVMLLLLIKSARQKNPDTS